MEAPTKNLLQSKSSIIAIWRYSSDTSCKKKWNFQKENLLLCLTVCTIFKTFRPKASKSSQISLSKPEKEIGSTKWKDNLSILYYNDITEHSKSQISVTFCFEGNKFCTSSIKNLNYTIISWSLQKLSTLIIAKLSTSTRTDITLKACVK